MWLLLYMEKEICFEWWFHLLSNILMGDRGSMVVKVLCYKSEGRWFDSS